MTNLTQIVSLNLALNNQKNSPRHVIFNLFIQAIWIKFPNELRHSYLSKMLGLGDNEKD